MKVLVGSTDPSKTESVRRAFSRYFDKLTVKCVEVRNNSHSELADSSLYMAARNSVVNLTNQARDENMNADYFVSIETGVINMISSHIMTSIAVIRDKEGYESWGSSPGLPIPKQLVGKIVNGETDIIVKKRIVGEQEMVISGGIDTLTRGAISKLDMYEIATIMALTQFINKKTWHDQNQKDLGKELVKKL